MTWSDSYNPNWSGYLDTSGPHLYNTATTPQKNRKQRRLEAAQERKKNRYD